MNAKEVYQSGSDPFVEFSFGRFYTDAEGNITSKAPEGKYEVGCEALIKIGIPVDMPDEVTKAAVEHSMTRKGQEAVQAEGRKEIPNFQAFADGFIAAYYANMLNEKAEKAAKEPKDTLHSRILAQISGTLRDKVAKNWDFSTAKVAIPGADNPPKMVVGKDKKEVINFNAWSKLFTEDHPWYVRVKKDLEKIADKMD